MGKRICRNWYYCISLLLCRWRWVSILVVLYTCIPMKCTAFYFSFVQPDICTLRSSLFWDVRQHTTVVTEVSGQPIGSIISNCLNLENGTSRLSWNVSNCQSVLYNILQLLISRLHYGEAWNHTFIGVLLTVHLYIIL